MSGTKSITGHLLGAAGAIEFIIGVLALKQGVIPATMNTQNLDQAIPDRLNIVPKSQLADV